jgi:uncharacterized membrane protein YccF (DUF307 family)
MALIGNVIWFVFGGLVMGLLWAVVGLIAFITVIGIPWGKACFMLANFSFFPFGREVINRKDLTGQDDVGTGKWGMVGNIVWFLLAGWELALGHVISGLLTCITIIGIPFGIQHFKLAGAALFPVGKTVVDKHLAAAAQAKNAEGKLSSLRS